MPPGGAGRDDGGDFQKGIDAYKNSDYATALREWTPFTERGDTDAQALLGYMYEEGKGFPQDYKTAEKWFKLATEQGDAEVQAILGVMYSKGQGVPQDNVYALMWSNIAASSGDKKAEGKRVLLEKLMKPFQIVKAKKLAKECLSKKYKGC